MSMPNHGTGRRRWHDQSRQQNNLAKFKNADVIQGTRHARLQRVRGQLRLLLQKGGIRLHAVPAQHTSTRWPGAATSPEAAYPAFIPGMREIGARTTPEPVGAVYPRGGFCTRPTILQGRAVWWPSAPGMWSRDAGCLHVYQPLLASSRDGYWPAGALMETDASPAEWQGSSTPRMSSSCTVFRAAARDQAQQGDYALGVVASA